MHANHPALALAFALALVALPPAAAQAAVESTVLDGNPCRPPDSPYDEAWCTAKGSVHAVVLFVDNVYDGNYTTLQDYSDGAEAMKGQILACVWSRGDDPECPNKLVAIAT